MSTFSKLRVGKKGAYAGSPTLNAVVTVAAGAAAATGVVLPKGARVLSVACDGTGTGTTPTFDLGVSGTTNQFANDVASDAVSITASASMAVLTTDTELWAGDGTGTVTGGCTVVVNYMINDDKNGVNG